MNRLVILGMATALMLAMPGCASVRGKGKNSYTIKVQSTPSEASVKVRNTKNAIVFQGQTPTTVTLRSSAGYFQKAKYTFDFTKPGYKPASVVMQADLNRWYFGNVLFGGLMGSLIIDPLTGAMYTFDNEVTVKLEKK